MVSRWTPAGAIPGVTGNAGAAMTDDPDTRRAFLEPLVRYLNETSSRVPFSDWYDTHSGKYEAFIACSVQGGIFTPMLKPVAVNRPAKGSDEV